MMFSNEQMQKRVRNNIACHDFLKIYKCYDKILRKSYKKKVLKILNYLKIGFKINLLQNDIFIINLFDCFCVIYLL